MNIHRYATAQEFLAHTREYLEQEEIINSLPLGICHRMLGGTTQQAEPRLFAALYHESAIAAVTVCTPPHHPIVVCNTNDYCKEEMSLLARFLLQEYPDVRGVIGRIPIVQLCAKAIAEHSNQQVKQLFGMHLYQAQRIIPAPPCAGTSRLASLTDAPLLVEWTEQFLLESLHQPSTRQQLQTTVAKGIQDGEISVWEHGEVVSMAIKNRATRTTASIASVYTPKEHRGRGYAAANVAAFSQRLLNEGYQTCVLFTDAANPTSNALYQRIGYQHVCDFAHYTMDSL